MSWYNQKQKKTASKSQKAFFNQESNCDAENQTGHFMLIFDTQRYVFDSYQIKLALAQTENRFSVSITCNHSFLGTITWDQYWFYDLGEFKQAQKTFDRIKEVAREIMTMFIDQEMPTPMFWAYLKKGVGNIDHDATERYNIPVLNYAEHYRNLSSPDWKNNIYGLRYPRTNTEKSIRQYGKGKGK